MLLFNANRWSVTVFTLLLIVESVAVIDWSKNDKTHYTFGVFINYRPALTSFSSTMGLFLKKIYWKTGLFGFSFFIVYLFNWNLSSYLGILISFYLPEEVLKKIKILKSFCKITFFLAEQKDDTDFELAPKLLLMIALILQES